MSAAIEKMRLLGRCVLIGADYWSVVLAELIVMALMLVVGNLTIAFSSYFIFLELPIIYIGMMWLHHGYDWQVKSSLLGRFVKTARDGLAIVILWGYFGAWLSVDHIIFLLATTVLLIPNLLLLRRWFYKTVDNFIKD